MASSASNMSQPVSNVPTTSTFSFKAPYPASSSSGATASALKHRRVSLASPSSPRVVQAWSFRDDTGLDSHSGTASSSTNGQLGPEKKGKMRKIDTSVEEDDGSPMQEKKPRKKWSQEETQMLVNGCRQHGVGNWKTILQDPDLQFHDRSAVDLKDRFRTYFPDAYKQHYPNARTHLSSKVRSTLPDGSSLFEKARGKRRRPFSPEEDRALKAGYEKHGTIWATIVKDPIFQEQNRRSTDLRDRFRNAFPSLYQAAGYKPRTASKKKMDGPIRAATDDQLSMSTAGPVRRRRRAQTNQGLLRGGTKSVPQSTACSEDEESSAGEEDAEPSRSFRAPDTPVFVDNVSTFSSRTRMRNAREPFILDDDDDEMEMVVLDPLADDLNIPDFLPSETHSDMETWSSGIDTPTHSSHAWSTAAASPTSSHLSDYLMNASSHSSPYLQRRGDFLGGNNFGMIGKSAWGTHDWFSPNPRLDASSGSSASSSFADGFSPASPFSFHPHLNHGVFDRYDLFPASMPNEILSEAGANHTHATFSDGSSNPTGFKGYHSQIAGDLISGARTHQPQSGFYGSGLGIAGNGDISGLGLSGMSQTTGIHPMQLHQPSLLSIDELGLTGITLNDRVDSVVPTPNAMDDGTSDTVLDLAFNLARSPGKHHLQHQHHQQKDEPEELSLHCDSFSLDDLVDMSNELHTTPPATPISQPRPLRRQHYGDAGAGHARSISVPPSEARTLTMSPPNFHSQLGGIGRAVQSFFSPSSPSLRQRNPEPVRLSNSTGSIQSSMQHPQSLGGSATLLPDHLMLASSPASTASTTNSDLWRSSVSAAACSSSSLATVSNSFTPGDLYNLPFLDLHYYGHTYASMALNSHTLGLGGMDGAMSDQPTAVEVARQGQALDLAHSAVMASSGLAMKSFDPHASRHQASVQLEQTIRGSAVMPSAVSVSSLITAANGGGGTIRQSHITGPGSGRSMSHHRGQSAVCPQDLVIRHENNKRKRASWDGGNV